MKHQHFPVNEDVRNLARASIQHTWPQADQAISGSFNDFTSTYGAPDAAAMLSISVQITESSARQYRQLQQALTHGNRT